MRTGIAGIVVAAWCGLAEGAWAGGDAPVLHDAGFTDLRTDHFTNVKGHHYALSRAFRPRR